MSHQLADVIRFAAFGTQNGQMLMR